MARSFNFTLPPKPGILSLGLHPGIRLRDADRRVAHAGQLLGNGSLRFGLEGAGNNLSGLVPDLVLEGRGSHV